MQKFVAFLAVLAVVIMLSGSASADMLAQWKIEQAMSQGTAPVTTVASGVSSTALTVAPTPTRMHPGISWPDSVGTYAENWRLGAGLEFAMQENDYYRFTVTPDSGTVVDLSNLFVLFSVNDGAAPCDVTFHLLSSQTGLTYDPLGGNVIGTLHVTATGTGYNPQIYPTNFDLSSVAALQNVTTPTEFRIYFTSAVGNRMGIGHAWGLPDDVDVQLDGTIGAIPEPASLALLGAAVLLSAAARKKM